MKVLWKHVFSGQVQLADYYNLGVLLENEALFLDYKNRWNELKDTPELIDSFEYHGIKFYKQARPIFNLVFNSIFYLIADNVNITKRILETEKPSCVVLDHDENFYGKGFMVNNAKVIALQHEAVLPTDSNHFHIKDEKALEKGVNWRPLPVKKCVSGKSAYNILKDKCNYPEANLVLTGRAEFDGQRNNPGDAHIRTILYAAEYFKITEKFVEALHNNPIKAEIIIKPHPEHNMKPFKKLVKGTGFVLADKDADTHKLVEEADVVVTDYCMVGMEALAKGVPFVVYNPFGDDDIYGFRKGGVIETRTAEELRKEIRYALTNPDEYARITRHYILNQNYLCDGKATDRVVEVIKSVVR